MHGFTDPDYLEDISPDEEITLMAGEEFTVTMAASVQDIAATNVQSRVCVGFAPLPDGNMNPSCEGWNRCREIGCFAPDW